MERRPDPHQDEILSEDALKVLERHLSMLSGPHVEDFYDQKHRECCRGGRGLPPPRVIQQLVTAWKLLRKWSRR